MVDHAGVKTSRSTHPRNDSCRINEVTLADYWQQYTESQSRGDIPAAPYDVARFGDTPALADTLGELIVSGRKTATCSALWEYEAENEPLPRPGTRAIVVNGRGVPLCIIETTAVEIRRFCDVDPQFAFDEGEGDRSLAYWRSEHWQFFTRSLRQIRREPRDNMPLVCERFRVIYIW